MDWLWTWGGRFFGYRAGEDLWTYQGKHVGRFYDDEVYGPRGEYLGELMGGRLITHLGKKHWMKPPFTPWANRGAYGRYADYVGYVMYAGYGDFPQLDER